MRISVRRPAQEQTRPAAVTRTNHRPNSNLGSALPRRGVPRRSPLLPLPDGLRTGLPALLIPARHSPTARRRSSASSPSPPPPTGRRELPLAVDDVDRPEFAAAACGHADVLAGPPPSLPPDRAPAFELHIETDTHPTPRSRPMKR